MSLPPLLLPRTPWTRTASNIPLPPQYQSLQRRQHHHDPNHDGRSRIWPAPPKAPTWPNVRVSMHTRPSRWSIPCRRRGLAKTLYLPLYISSVSLSFRSLTHYIVPPNHLVFLSDESHIFLMKPESYVFVLLLVGRRLFSTYIGVWGILATCISSLHISCEQFFALFPTANTPDIGLFSRVIFIFEDITENCELAQ